MDTHDKPGPSDIEADATDPELEPLLGFAPVHRHTRRSDGWSAENQRDFVAALARLGNVDRAAHTIGRTSAGAYKVRTSANAESFAAAWDGALALWHHRNPKPRRVGRPSRGELLANPPPPVEDEAEPADDEQDMLEFLAEMFERYKLKLAAERAARLAGRIAEADFIVRQLTFIEVILDLGGRAQDMLDLLTPPQHVLVHVAATPMSVLLDGLRREYWAEGGEPERPPLGDLGEHDDAFSTGPAMSYNLGRAGVDYATWRGHRDEQAALAADAQVAWETKARADAEQWRERLSRP